MSQERRAQESLDTELDTEGGSTGEGRILESVPEPSGRVVMVPLEQLKRGPMVRVMGEDPAHARLLACTPRQLPPILVHKSSLTVIDGMHRVMAAGLRGERTIAVRFFEGSDAEAFVAAVEANIEHGKPLTLVDREKAAERIAFLHPEWSDRAIGETCALSPKTVAGVRRRTTEESPQLEMRTGRDGRARPVDPIPGRQRIAIALQQDPRASLRQVAAQTGTSVGTVADVRRRLAEGRSAFPDGAHRRFEPAEVMVPEAPENGVWADDSACISTEGGSQFADWFDASQVHTEDCHRYVDVPPLSRLYAIVAESQARARIWAQYAADLESRARKEASARTAE